VMGVLSADPKRVQDTVLFPKLSYQEAAEMTYYGASVIHPKTIKPLANKKIPLFVRSFVNPTASGTCIGDFKQALPAPAVIFKSDQSLIRFEARDLSNINQQTLVQLIDEISALNIKINLMMNTAVSFSICINTNAVKIARVEEKMKPFFDITISNNLELVTIKNYNKVWQDKFYDAEKALIALKTQKNFQFVQEV